MRVPEGAAREATTPGSDIGRPRPRIDGIDAARGAAALLVVLMHASVPVREELPTVLTWFNWVAGGVRMPLLLFLSGYLAQSMLRDQRRALARAANMAWVYVVWTFVGWATNGWSLPELLVVPRSSLWFIWALAFAAATLPLARRLPAWTVLGAAASVSLSSYAGLIPADPATVEHLLRQLLFFYVGLYLGPSIVKALLARPIRLAALGALVALVALPLDVWIRDMLDMHLLAIPQRLGGIVAALGVALCLPVVATRPLAWFGQHSLPIYVGHLMLLVPLGTLFAEAPALVRALGVTVLATGLSLVVHRVALSIRLDVLYRRPRLG